MAASTPTPIAIELHQLGHEFLEGKPVFRGVSSEIKAGTHAVINGQNGSGKSTLGKILSGQLTATEGTIAWNQNDADLPQQELLLEASFAGPSTSLHPLEHRRNPEIPWYVPELASRCKSSGLLAFRWTAAPHARSVL